MEIKEVRIPLAGNAFLESDVNGGRITPAGITGWTNEEAVFGIYVSFSKPSEFMAVLKLKKQKNNSVLKLSCGETEYTVEVSAGSESAVFGTFTAGQGYVRFVLSGVSKDGGEFASADELVLQGIDEENIAAYVAYDNPGNFYWTRRGPSVHCSYDTRDAGDVEWFYNEVTVPEGYDPVGTYAMAIGFDGGYFGIQTNSKRERRILFSVWSPFSTDNPDEIPEDKRIICLGHNERTHVGEFGGEGSGGQSYMKYMWKTGVTQKFLMHVRPDGNGRTEYTAYFYFPESGRFEMVASFLRPETDRWLTRAHSFVENFADTNGYITRMAYFGNRWAYTNDGRWFRPEKIKFTGDATARSRWRIDYDGGLTEDGRLYLKNGGFFDEHAVLDTVFTCSCGEAEPPAASPLDLIL